MLQITKGYIQGALDGEGCISKHLGDHYESWHLCISNTDLVWLQSIARYLKSRGYHPNIQRQGRSGTSHWKQGYVLNLHRRTEIKRFLTEFPPLMAARQKKAAAFFLWDKQYKRRMPKGSDSVLQQAMSILKDTQDQGRLI